MLFRIEAQEFEISEAVVREAEKMLLIVERRIVWIPGVDGPRLKHLAAEVVAIYAEDAEAHRRQVWVGRIQEGRQEIPPLVEPWLTKLAKALWGSR